MNFLRRFFYGRNGLDALGLFIAALYLLCHLALVFIGWWPLYFISGLLSFVFLFRVLSHNLPQRQQENAAFSRAFSPFFQWIQHQNMIRRDKNHRYLKCPICRQQLRIPRIKGKLRITCRSCGASFEIKN